MVNPNAEQIDDMSTFRYRNVTYNTRPDGTGLSNDLPVNNLRRVKIYPEYRDTYYGDLFLGKRKGEQGEIMHKEFMSNLNISGDKLILKHDSTVKITDGVIKKGKTNGYSKDSDIGIYFWGSKKIGSDISNGQTYTYICTVPLSDVYDFQTNLERFPSLDQAMLEHKYCAQYWKKSKAIVVNTFHQTPIQAIKDNTNGKVYNANWEQIDMQVESKK